MGRQGRPALGGDADETGVNNLRLRSVSVECNVRAWRMVDPGSWSMTGEAAVLQVEMRYRRPECKPANEQGTKRLRRLRNSWRSSRHTQALQCSMQRVGPVTALPSLLFLRQYLILSVDCFSYSLLESASIRGSHCWKNICLVQTATELSDQAPITWNLSCSLFTVQ